MQNFWNCVDKFNMGKIYTYLISYNNKKKTIYMMIQHFWYVTLHQQVKVSTVWTDHSASEASVIIYQ
jgi:hypothetical protein